MIDHIQGNHTRLFLFVVDFRRIGDDISFDIGNVEFAFKNRYVPAGLGLDRRTDTVSVAVFVLYFFE